MSFFKFLFDIWKERKGSFSLIAVMMTVVALVETAKILLVIPLLTLVLSEDVSSEGLGFLGRVVDFLKGISGLIGVPFSLGFVLALVIGMFALGAALKIIQMHFQYKLRLNYMFSLSHRLCSSFFSAPWSFFVNNKPGKLVNILAAEIPRAGVAFHHLCMTISSFLVILVYILLVIFISWKLTIFVLLMVPLFFVLFRRLTYLSEKYGAKTTKMNNKLQAESFENILAAKMIKASASEKQSVNLIDSIVKKVQRYYYLTMMTIALMTSLQEPIGIIILSLAIYISLAFLHLNPQLIILVLIVFFRLMPRFYEAQRNYQQAISLIPAFHEVNRMMSITQKIKERSGHKVFKELKEEIVFKDVFFSYEKDKPVLKGINIQIPKGQIIGIVGQSGSGKSTIADLIVGLIQPSKGEILVDGVPLSEYDCYSWRRSIGYVTQEMNLFHDTVRANLTWNRQDATEEEIIQAVKLGNAHEFIIKLPHSYDTVIGDRGYRLSGGQRQRLALSRVILSNPQIYIFDEATSALDSNSEAKIQQSIDSLAATRTTLAIAHRISTLKNADKIYVLDHNCIVESGSWDELVVKSGIFKQLISMQSL